MCDVMIPGAAGLLLCGAGSTSSSAPSPAAGLSSTCASPTAVDSAVVGDPPLTSGTLITATR